MSWVAGWLAGFGADCFLEGLSWVLLAAVVSWFADEVETRLKPISLAGFFYESDVS